MDPHHLVNGVLVPPFVLQSRVDKLKQMDLYLDDVWVVSYPKSGTTWTQQIVRLIRNNGERMNTKISDDVPYLEATAAVGSMNVDDYCSELNLEDLPRPRAFKSHFPYNCLPCGPPHTTPCKYIYVARNPKDVVVSLYCFLQGFAGLEWDKFWKSHIEGNSPYGDHIAHLLSWWAHKDEENVLFLKYEDMKKDPSRAVSQIASFLGADLSADTISKIVDLTSFKKMKADNTANFSWDKASIKDGEPTFLRKGIVGDWKNILTPEQSAQMDATWEEKQKGTGLILDFE